MLKSLFVFKKKKMLNVKPLDASERVSWCFEEAHSHQRTWERPSKKASDTFLLLPSTSPHPGRWEHFHSPLWIFFFISSNSRPFCSSKSPIYSSAEVERSVRVVFSEEEEVFMKERQISARQLDYGDTSPGSRAGISPRAGSRSPTHVEVQCRWVVREW